MKCVLTVVFAFLLLQWSCTEEEYNYDDPTDLAMFSLESGSFVAKQGLADNLKEFWIASSVRVAEDRTYLVQVQSKGSDEEAEENEQFELPSSIVTIPAGELTGSFRLRAWPQALSETEEKVAYLSLVAVDEDHPVADFNNTMSVTLRRTCPFTPADMAGRVDIYTTLLNLGTWENKIARVAVEADPAVSNGFIVKSPYAEGQDLKMRMWEMEQGTWEVQMEDVFLTRIVPDDPRAVPYDVYGYGHGMWYPCMRQMVLIYYLHVEGSDEVMATVTERFEKLD